VLVEHRYDFQGYQYEAVCKFDGNLTFLGVKEMELLSTSRYSLQDGDANTDWSYCFAYRTLAFRTPAGFRTFHPTSSTGTAVKYAGGAESLWEIERLSGNQGIFVRRLHPQTMVILSERHWNEAGMNNIYGYSGGAEGLWVLYYLNEKRIRRLDSTGCVLVGEWSLPGFPLNWVMDVGGK
jgi:hypothetical protein